jgi:hypothetical protein
MEKHELELVTSTWLVIDWALLTRPAGRGLTTVPVMQLLVPMGRVLMLPGGGMELGGGHMALLQAGELRLL